MVIYKGCKDRKISRESRVESREPRARRLKGDWSAIADDRRRIGIETPFAFAMLRHFPLDRGKEASNSPNWSLSLYPVQRLGPTVPPGKG